MNASVFTRLAGLGLALGFLGTAAQAQTNGNPDLPRSPYALPAPTYHGQDDDVGGILLGDGPPPRPGVWRHWGDDKQQGETFKELFAPDGIVGDRAGDREPRYRGD